MSEVNFSKEEKGVPVKVNIVVQKEVDNIIQVNLLKINKVDGTFNIIKKVLKDFNDTFEILKGNLVDSFFETDNLVEIKNNELVQEVIVPFTVDIFNNPVEGIIKEKKQDNNVVMVLKIRIVNIA